mmetsp:Transcript_8617/g.19501  ORF Transcript_8617/g.19501 Transcript_8617/m.19501 type:complete len:304 (-) Transcript_8617:633-1544(-)
MQGQALALGVLERLRMLQRPVENFSRAREVSLLDLDLRLLHPDLVQLQRPQLLDVLLRLRCLQRLRHGRRPTDQLMHLSLLHELVELARPLGADHEQLVRKLANMRAMLTATKLLVEHGLAEEEKSMQVRVLKDPAGDKLEHLEHRDRLELQIVFEEEAGELVKVVEEEERLPHRPLVQDLLIAPLVCHESLAQLLLQLVSYPLLRLCRKLEALGVSGVVRGRTFCHDGSDRHLQDSEEVMVSNDELLHDLESVRAHLCQHDVDPPKLEQVHHVQALRLLPRPRRRAERVHAPLLRGSYRLGL